jgi:hypothetical protein
MDRTLGQYLFRQRIDQRLGLHAALSDPLCQSRRSNRQPVRPKTLLPVQR